MERAVELAGFFAAHGIWCVADGEVLIPMLAQESAGSERNLLRFESDELEEAVAEAHRHFDANPDGSERSVLVYDGTMPTATGETDALFVIVRSYADPDATLSMAVPYRHADSPEGFAVHRPTFVDWHGLGEPDVAALGAAFFRGVGAHEEAAEVWAEHADESR